MEMKEFYDRPKLQDFFFLLRVPGPEGPSKTEVQFTDADFAKFSSVGKRERKNKIPNSCVCYKIINTRYRFFLQTKQGGLKKHESCSYFLSKLDRIS